MLNKADLEIGAYVTYRTEHKTEVGRIKSWNDRWVFVVYRCDGNWDRFEDYTGCATDIKDLYVN